MVGKIRVLQRCAVAVVERLILNYRSECNLSKVERRSVRGKNLKRGTRLGIIIGCAVEGKTCCFFSASADDGFHVTGALIHNGHARLRLRGEAAALGNNRIALLHDSGFVLVDIALCLLLGVKEQIEIRIAVAEVELQHLFAVVLYLAVCLLYGERPVETDLRVRREVLRILEFRIENRLHVGILCGIDFEAAAVDNVLCLHFGVAFLYHQIVDQVGDDFIDKVGVRRALRLGLRVHGDAVVNIVVHGNGVFFFGDVALLFHVVQDLVAALLVFLRVVFRIICRRRLWNCGKNGAFRERQIFCILSEIRLRCRLDTVAAGT